MTHQSMDRYAGERHDDAHAAATLYSLIETEKACRLELYRYLRFLFSKIP